LYKWQQHMQEVHAIITGDTLKEKAAQLWEAFAAVCWARHAKMEQRLAWTL